MPRGEEDKGTRAGTSWQGLPYRMRALLAFFQVLGVPFGGLAAKSAHHDHL